MKRQEQETILNLWKDWCLLWPEQYGHESLQVDGQGYDPVFDLIPAQTYKDFYFEVVRGHPQLKHLNAFEVVDTCLNQITAPETPVVRKPVEPRKADTTDSVEDLLADVDLPDNIEPLIVEVELLPVYDPNDPEQQVDIA